MYFAFIKMLFLGFIVTLKLLNFAPLNVTEFYLHMLPSKLSPTIFNWYTEDIFREAKHKKGIRISGRIINNIRYSDDTALLADNMEALTNLMEKVNVNGKLWV